MDRESITLSKGDGCIVIREDRSVHGFMPITDAEILEDDSPSFWAYAIMMMMGEGEESAEMRQTLKEWFEKLCNG